MIEAARQRTVVPTRTSNAALLAVVLAMHVLPAHAQQQQSDADPKPAADTQSAPQPQSHSQKRSVSAQAAIAAAEAQDATTQEPFAATPQDPATQESVDRMQPSLATSPTSADARSDVASTTPPMQAAATRGVLFRITPPAAVLLPAEVLEQQQSLDPDAAANASVPRAAEEVNSEVAAQAPRSASYLLATIHFGTPEEQGIDYTVLERTLAAVDTFVNEADLDSAWQPAFDAYRWLPPEQPLPRMIGKESFATARALLPKVRPQDLERMKPWSVLALLEARGESGGETTMDARLQRIAEASGKRMLHLETLEQQLQALDCVPASEHALVLDERLRASWILRIESARAMAFYRSRNLEAWLADIDRLEGLSAPAQAVEHRARRCLLEDRNARWIGQLQSLIQDGPCLVAVGAVHLVGADGLLAALRRDGYGVEAQPL